MSARKTAKPKAPFADTAKPERKKKAQGASAASRERKREAYERLIASDDFREFMFETIYTLCAFEHDLRNTTEFERGIRSAGSFIRRVLLVADGAPQFFADLDKRYYAGVRRGIIEAQNKEQGDQNA